MRSHLAHAPQVVNQPAVGLIVAVIVAVIILRYLKVILLMLAVAVMVILLGGGQIEIESLVAEIEPIVRKVLEDLRSAFGS